MVRCRSAVARVAVVQNLLHQLSCKSSSSVSDEYRRCAMSEKNLVNEKSGYLHGSASGQGFRFCESGEIVRCDNYPLVAGFRRRKGAKQVHSNLLKRFGGWLNRLEKARGLRWRRFPALALSAGADITGSMGRKPWPVVACSDPRKSTRLSQVSRCWVVVTCLKNFIAQV